MISRAESRCWTFYEEHEPVAITIYKPCTAHNQLFLIVEEPSEGGPNINQFDLQKELVAAAFGLSPEDVDTENYIEKLQGYAVTIPQVLHDWKTNKYFIGILDKMDNGEWIVASTDPNDLQSASRPEVVAHLLRDKSIWERIDIIKKAEALPF